MTSTGDTGRSRHTKFDGGMMRDVASWELPEGATYDAVDMLCDYAGKIRKRGGTTSPASGNSAATVENLVNFKSNAQDAITAVIGSSGKSGAVTKFTTSTGATATLLAALSAPVYACRPFQHRNWMVVSHQMLAATANDTNHLYIWGGATASTSALAGAMSAGQNLVTGLTSAALNSTHLGGIFTSADSSGNNYAGRVIEIVSATSLRVDPVPEVSQTIATMHVDAFFPVNGTRLVGGLIDPGDVTGRYGISFQGRIVLGDCDQTTSFGPADYPAMGLHRFPRRLWWSLLSTEEPYNPFVGSAVLDGDNVAMPGLLTNTGAVASFNYVDIDALQTMTGLAAIGDGQLIIFGPQQMFRLSGQLTTETVQDNVVSFSVDQISSNVGCVSAKSIQYARGGIVWAAYDNVYEYDGASLKPLLNGRNQRYYQDLLRGGATIYGSANFLNRNHYYLSLSGSQGGLCINLDSLAQTRWTGPTTQLFDSTYDPTDPTILLGARWWDTTGAAPTMTKGQLIRLDPIFLPAQANSSDGDGTAVTFDIQTASYVNGPSITNTKMTSDVVVAFDQRGTGSPTTTVKADTKLNTSDASYITVTSSLAVTGTTASSQRFDIGNLLPDGSAIEMRFTGNAAMASFELLSLDFGTQQRPEQFGAS